MVANRLRPSGAVYLVQNAVPRKLIDELLRLFARDLVDNPIDYDTYRAWRHSTAFPHLREHSLVKSLQNIVADNVKGPGHWAEPQIVMHRPDELTSWDMQPHVDEPPPWANTNYNTIVGVALTRSHVKDGCLHVLTATDRKWVPVEMEAGEMLVMTPDTPHSTTVNTSKRTRVAIYYRRLD